MVARWASRTREGLDALVQRQLLAAVIARYWYATSHDDLGCRIEHRLIMRDKPDLAIPDWLHRPVIVAQVGDNLCHLLGGYLP